MSGQRNYKKELERFLPGVEKPARYTGGEWNSVTKAWDAKKVKIAFAFPDVYEVGMSHLGLQILYHTVNRREDALMERVFAPWTDMEQILRTHHLPLLAIESGRPVAEFDMLAFTLQYEMSFSNILNMLDLAGIPLMAKDRGPDWPLIVAGGPCAFNPEPLADYIDVFAIGEGEELIHDIIDTYAACGRDRDRLLLKLAGVRGVYVPRFYHVSYRADGSIESVTPKMNGVPARVTKRVVAGYDRIDFPDRPIVPNLGVVHDRIMLEVLRGCTRGCRFCQAGAIYRPVREKSPATLMDQACCLADNTGYDEISLTSLSSADYSQINRLASGLLNKLDARGIGISLPSLRVDAFSVGLAREIQRVRRSGLTFAPEAGSQRLRDVINKGVTEENLVAAVEAAFSAGWRSVKLYFMIGLPTETIADLDGIGQLASLVLKHGRRASGGKGIGVTVSASTFVPKAHTPFQWEPQNKLQEVREKQEYLRSLLKDKRISFKWHDPELSFMEGVFARGDRRLSAVLEKAWRMGCRFDGWSECFKFDRWLNAFAGTGLDPCWYTYRRYAYTDVLPWDHIGSGVSRDYLIKEHEKALEAVTTSDCRKSGCAGCGVCPDLGVEPELIGGEDCVPLPD